jgi:ankyrin repeat protein
MIDMRAHIGILIGGIALASLTKVSAAGDSRLVEAVKSRNAAAVRLLLQQHVDVNAPQPDGATALHWAVYADDLGTAELLIRAGAKVNATNELGVTPLYLACVSRNAAIAEKLLAAGANANAALPSGESALMTAARTGSADVIKTLVAHGADVNRTEPDHRETALMWAVASQHPDAVKTLVEVGADVQARSAVRHRRVQVGQRFSDHDARTTAYMDLGGFTPLLFSARQGDVESAKALLAAGAHVNDRSASGTSALVVAAHSAQRALALLLLDKGADPNAAEAGYTALHAAVLRGDLELARALLAHGANPNAEMTKGTPVRYISQDYALNVAFLGATPYWLAAKFAETDMMRALVASGADPRHIIKDGTTPLIAALTGTGGNVVGTTSDRRERVLTPTELTARDEAAEERRTQEAFQLAIELGSDLNAANKAGDTALHLAAVRGYTDAVQMLLDRGAMVNVANRLGDTPLHNAASRAYPAIIQLLAQHGAELEAKNKRGQTPLAMTMSQAGIGGASFIPDENRQGAADALRKLGANQ